MIASVSYNTSGSAGPYTITFPYLEEADVDVYLDGVANTAFTIASVTQLTLNSAPSATVIEIRRSTNNTPYVDFTAPAPIIPEDLDTATLQAIYIAQEAVDAAARLDENALQLDATETFWDAESKRIQNLATPTAANHAVTKAYADGLVIAEGNVPPPVNPTDDGKVLTANAGLFDWQVAGGGDSIPETIVDAKGDLIVATAADTVARRAVGANNTVLTADSAEVDGVKWAAVPADATAIPKAIVDAKGDLIVATAADTVARRAVGTNGQVLTADSAEADGVKWASPGASKPAFVLTPEAAAFPAANFPQLVKNVGSANLDHTLDFDQTTGESCFFRFKIPVGVTFTGAEIEIASRQAAAVSGTLGWVVTTRKGSDGNSWDDGAIGEASTVTASTVKGTAGQILMQTKTISFGSAWAAGDIVAVKVERDVANDTVAEDGKLMSVVIRLT